VPPTPTPTVPRVARPSLKVTEPELGAPVSDATCAVIATLELNVDGFGDEETVVVVAALQPGSATSVSNGVSTTPVKAMLSTVQPNVPTPLSEPSRKRNWTVEPGAMAAVMFAWTVPPLLLTKPGPEIAPPAMMVPL